MSGSYRRRRPTRMNRAKARAERLRKFFKISVAIITFIIVIFCIVKFFIYEKDNISKLFTRKAVAQTEVVPETESVSTGSEAGETNAEEPETTSPVLEATPSEAEEIPAYPDPNKPMIAFTFDDGPYAKVDNRILDALEPYGGHVTFFIVGSRINDYPTTLKRIHESGSEIANHTYDHKNLEKLTPEEVFMEVELTNEYLDAAIGARTNLVRVPYGAYGGAVCQLVAYPIIQWNVDTEDWKSKNKEAIVEAVLAHAKDGNIILMHDIYESTAEAFEELVPQLAAQGFQFVTVSELYRAKGISMEPGQVYFSTH